MIVKALSHKLQRPLIQVKPSSLFRKYLGETALLTNAVFSLAYKLEPCFILVDEVDCLFQNSKFEDMRSEFIQNFDYLSKSTHRVIVFGTTNKPQELDPAIKRRFERYYEIGNIY